MKRLGRLLVSALALMLLVCASAGAEPWKFGVMADTQWIGADDGHNPNSVAVGIINQINAQFLEARVKFVIQVGDLVDKYADAAMQTRAAAAQALYDAGIGFFPLRGNHESTQAAASSFQAAFPQTQGQGANVFGATRFSSPSADLAGLSYAFDYRNVRFVLLDQFTPPSGAADPTPIDSQQAWITGELSTKPRYGHALVFAHKNLIGQNHVDTLFGSSPAADPAGQNAFIGGLHQAGVRYFFSGHDHIHHRSIVASPDGTAAVQEIIGASDSSKFYIPAIPSNDQKYDTPIRELPIAQERNTIGYYIVTVDGPRVTVDFYSAIAAPALDSTGSEYLISATPSLVFTKRETFGYSVNGREFVVAQGQSYTGIQDSFESTHARILSGGNGSTATDGSNRPLVKTVNTGWSDETDENLTSDVLTVWGMANGLGSGRTDTYTIALSHGHPRFPWFGPGPGILSTRDDRGNWVNAVERNYGGTPRFVLGPWVSGYGLGTFGYDPRTRTAWAVVNHEGEFAISKTMGDWR